MAALRRLSDGVLVVSAGMLNVEYEVEVEVAGFLFVYPWAESG
jgi:hypothetical protein